MIVLDSTPLVVRGQDIPARGVVTITTIIEEAAVAMESHLRRERGDRETGILVEERTTLKEIPSATT